MNEPRESSIPGVPERRFDTGEHLLSAASQITKMQDENRRLKAALLPFAKHGPHGVWKGTEYGDACKVAREVFGFTADQASDV